MWCCFPPSLPFTPTFLLAFIAEEMSYGMEYPFGEVGSAVLAMFPPKILPTTSLVVKGGGRILKGQCLKLWDPKLSCIYQHLSSYQYKPQNYEGYYGEN